MNTLGAVVVGSDDPSVTGLAGLALVAEADRVLGVIDALDSEVGWLKAPRRGLSAGEVIVSMAESMLADGDFMCDIDALRADKAGAALRAVSEPPASTTFAAAARRFDNKAVAAVETAMGIVIGRPKTGLSRTIGRRAPICAIPQCIHILMIRCTHEEPYDD